MMSPPPEEERLAALRARLARQRERGRERAKAAWAERRNEEPRTRPARAVRAAPESDVERAARLQRLHEYLARRQAETQARRRRTIAALETRRHELHTLTDTVLTPLLLARLRAWLQGNTGRPIQLRSRDGRVLRARVVSVSTHRVVLETVDDAGRTEVVALRAVEDARRMV